MLDFPCVYTDPVKLYPYRLRSPGTEASTSLLSLRRWLPAIRHAGTGISCYSYIEVRLAFSHSASSRAKRLF